MTGLPIIVTELFKRLFLNYDTTFFLKELLLDCPYVTALYLFDFTFFP